MSEESNGMHPATIAERLEHDILGGKYQQGVPIRQEALARQFGVSRTPIREALRMLQERGLVERDGRSGVRVHLASPDEYNQLFLVRAELEGFAAQLATSRMRRPHLREIERGHQLFEVAVERYTSAPPDDLEQQSEMFIAGVSAANEAFHDAVVDAAQCPPLTECVVNLRRRVPRELAWLAMHHDDGLLRDSIDDHDRVMQAIRDGDENAAREALTRHVLDAGATIIYWVGGQPRPRLLP